MGRKAKSHPWPEGARWLLPSLVRTLAILGVPSDIKGLVDFVHRESGDASLGKKLPADAKTLRKGPDMSPQKLRAVWRYLRRATRRLGTDAVFSTRALPAIYSPAQQRSPNTTAWQGVVLGLRQANLTDFPETLAFVERRCKLELEAIDAFVAAVERGDALAEIWRESLRDHTLIPAEHLGTTVEQLERWARARADGADPALTQELIALLLWLWWDPLLQLAAVAETEWRAANPHCCSQCAEDRSPAGAMGWLWPTWDGERLVLPAERFFDRLRHAVSRHRGLAVPIEWQVLAECIPDARFSTRLLSSGQDSPDSTKPNQLYHWRKGRRPTKEMFEAFVRNFGGNDTDVWMLEGLLRIAYGLQDEFDRMIPEANKRWPFPIGPVLGDIFSRYPLYLERARASGIPQGTPDAGLTSPA
jgi:hypothetical protein